MTHPEHVAWTGGTPARPYSKIADTPEGAYVRQLFDGLVKVWQDHWKEECSSDSRAILWVEARYDAHATYRAAA